MNKQQADINQFMRTAEQHIPSYPTIVPIDIRVLRAKLILEEALEQVEALGVCLHYDQGEKGLMVLESDRLDYGLAGEIDLTKFADGCADQIYVSLGALSALGINFEPIWVLVQAANMAKFGPGSYKRPDGKQMKPPGWAAPDDAIKEELLRQAHEGNGMEPLI